MRAQLAAQLVDLGSDRPGLRRLQVSGLEIPAAVRLDAGQGVKRAHGTQRFRESRRGGACDPVLYALEQDPLDVGSRQSDDVVLALIERLKRIHAVRETRP